MFNMDVVRKDLNLEHLWAIYPRGEAYRLADNITVLPLNSVKDLELPLRLCGVTGPPGEPF